MRLILHIGTTKTATTTLQRFLRSNRERLEAQGILFPSSLGEQSHERAAVYCTDFAAHPDLHQAHGIRSKEAHAEWAAELAVKFRKEVESFGEARAIVVSSEHLHSRGSTAESAARVLDLVARGCSELTVVCYLRPQIDHAVSLYSTVLRHGSKLDLEEFLERRLSTWESPYFNFYALLDVWGRAVGFENLKVRLFDDAKRRAGGVVDDFLTTAGLEELSECERPPAQNESISAAAQAILLMRNQAAPPGTSFGKGGSKAIFEYVTKNYRGPGLLPSRSLATAFQSRFREGNEWVRRRWFGHRRIILEPDWSKYDRPPPRVDLPQGLIELLMRQMYRSSSTGG